MLCVLSLSVQGLTRRSTSGSCTTKQHPQMTKQHPQMTKQHPRMTKQCPQSQLLCHLWALLCHSWVGGHLHAEQLDIGLIPLSQLQHRCCKRHQRLGLHFSPDRFQQNQALHQTSSATTKCAWWTCSFDLCLQICVGSRCLCLRICVGSRCLCLRICVGLSLLSLLSV